jgi:acyl carrier protein
MKSAHDRARAIIDRVVLAPEWDATLFDNGSDSFIATELRLELESTLHIQIPGEWLLHDSLAVLAEKCGQAAR